MRNIILSLFFTIFCMVLIISILTLDFINLREFKIILILGVILLELTFIIFSYKEKLLTKRNRTILLLSWMTLLMSFNYNTSFFNPNNKNFFINFQSDSESLVVEMINAKNDGIQNTGKYGLGNYYKDTKSINHYKSMYGLQGKVFQLLHKVYVKHILCIVLAAFVFSLICYFLMKKYGKLFASVFFITFLLSPWIVNFARNLYWVEFTWFIPMLFGIVCNMYVDNKKVRIGCYVGVFVSLLVKSLCGYEYLPVIMLSMIAFPLSDFFMDFFNKDRNSACKRFKVLVCMGICALAGFCIALLIHAKIRGNGNILDGLYSIYKKDVLRRTLGGNPENFDSIYTASLNATVMDVIGKYYNNWYTDVISGISGRYFAFISLIPIIIFMYKTLKNKLEMRKVFLYFILWGACISWFVLGKAHSYIHTHMNYVCWYFGFIQVCFYIIIDEVINYCETFLVPKLREMFSK